MTANRSPRWWRVIDWRLVLAAGVPAWLLVAGVVVWARYEARARYDFRFQLRSNAGGIETAPLARLVPEESPLPRRVNEVAELPRLVREDAPPPRAAVDPSPFLNVVMDVGRWLTAPKPVAKIDAQPIQPAAKPVPDGCKTHGTAVHFTRSTLEAVKQAKAKDKLVFVLHLSGNIEDDGFT